MEKKVSLQNDSLFQRTFQNVEKSSSFLDRTKFSSREGCRATAERNFESDSLQLKSGYEAIEGNSFYMQPQLKNTFHNYPVKQDDGMYCSENHQVFNNMTRRKVQFKPELDNTDLSNIIVEDKPRDLKFSPCKILNQK